MCFKFIKLRIPLMILILLVLLAGCNTEKSGEEGASNSTTAKTTIKKATVQSSVTPTPSPTAQVLTPTMEAENQAPQVSPITGFSKKGFQRVDGSTATIPLSEATAAELLRIKPEEAKNVVRHLTTHNAYENLIAGNADIIFVTEPSKQELELAKSKNIEIEVIPVVKDAFVFLVNKKNKIESLTIKELQDIYSGKITNWKQVGGADKKILAYQRPVNSGSQTLMLSKVMKGIKMVTPEKSMEPAGMGDLIEVVAGYDNSEFALGYSVYYYANTMYLRETVKLIGVEGVRPEPATIKSDKYPLTSAYYAVLRKNEPEKSFARDLLKWMLSEQGQKIAEKAGYIPLK